MIKELYINEKLFVSLQKDKIKAILIGEQYRSVGPKELKSESYSFIKRYPHIMESLKTGSIIKSVKDKSMTKTIIGKIETKNELTKEETLRIISEAEGYTLEESIENLEFTLHRPIKNKQKRKGKK